MRCEMKRIDIVHLSANLSLVFVNVINLLNMFYDLPLWLGFLTIPVSLASIVLYTIVIRRLIKKKKEDEHKKEN